MNQNYKLSYYSIMQKVGNGKLIWNTATGAVIFLDKEHQNLMSQFFQNQKEHRAPEFVKDLERLEIIVPASLNEKEEILKKFEQRGNDNLLSLTILPTEACNFRCLYCYEKFSNLTMPEEVEYAVARLVDNQTNHVKHLKVAWFGGEPLLNLSSIRRMSTKFQDICKSKAIDYSASITTNGYLLDPDTFSNLLYLGVRRFQVTIDGLAEDHNVRRPLKGGKPTFSRIVGHLKRITKLEGEFEVIVRANFDKDSIERMPDFLSWFQTNFGGDQRFFVYFRAIYPSGTEKDEKIPFCSIEEANWAVLRLLDWAIKKGLNQYFPTAVLPEPKPYYCEAMLPNHFVIGPDGSIWKCTLLMEPKDRVGWLKNSGQIEFNEKLDYWLSLSYRDDTKCLRCRFLPICHGGCPVGRSNRGGRVCIYSVPLAKKALKWIYATTKGGEPNDNFA